MTIMVGVSGSGKTTWAKTQRPDAVHCSADLYFIQADGTYKFDAKLLQNAHQSCFRAALQALLL